MIEFLSSLAKFWSALPGEARSWLVRQATRWRPRKPVSDPIGASPYSDSPKDIQLFLELGRKTLIEEVERHILNPDTSVVALVGPPGSGKTSLLKAGIGHLRHTDGQHVEIEIIELSQWHGESSIGSHQHRVIVQDALDVADPAIEARAKLLLNDLRRIDNTTLVVAFRSEFEPEWRKWKHLETAGNVHVGFFDLGEVKAVLNRLIEAHGLRVASAVRKLVLEELQAFSGDNGKVSPLHLSIVIWEIHQRFKGRSFSKRDYKGVVDLIQRFIYDAHTDSFGDNEDRLKRLIAAISHLARQGGPLPGKDIAAAVQADEGDIENLAVLRWRILEQVKNGGRRTFRIADDLFKKAVSSPFPPDVGKSPAPRTLRKKLIWATAVTVAAALAFTAYRVGVLPGRRLQKYGLPRELPIKLQQLDKLTLPSSVKSLTCLLTGSLFDRVRDRLGRRSKGRLSEITLEGADGLDCWLPGSITTARLGRNRFKCGPSFPGSLQVLDLTSAANYGDPESFPRSLTHLTLSGEITNQTRFPESLTWLSIDSPKLTSLAGLPENLTYLALRGQDLASLRGIKSKVRTLVLKNTQVPSLAELPPNLTLHSLSLLDNARLVISAEKLPPSIEELTIQLGMSSDPRPMTIDVAKLPTGLTTLSLTGKLLVVTGLDQISTRLPNLETLVLHQVTILRSPEELNRAPVCGSAVATALGNLPASLTSLEVKGLDLECIQFPPRLESLVLQQGRAIDLGGAPETVTKLSLGIDSIELPAIPSGVESLTILNVRRSHARALKSLGSKVKSLTIEKASLGSLVKLPDSVRELNVAYSRRLLKIEYLPQQLTRLSVRCTGVDALPEPLSDFLTSLDISGTRIRLQGFPPRLQKLVLPVPGGKGAPPPSLAGLPKSVNELSLLDEGAACAEASP